MKLKYVVNIQIVVLGESARPDLEDDMAYAYASTVSKGTQTKASLGHDLAAGALAGQVAGLIMAVVMMAVFTVFLGKGPLFPVQVIGSFVFGEPAVHGFHPGALVAGLLLHQLGPSLVWGLVLGAVVYATNVRGGTGLLAIGAATGLASQIIDVNVLVPAAMHALHGQNFWAENVPAFWSWAAHLVFGLSLASFTWSSRRLAPRSAR